MGTLALYIIININALFLGQKISVSKVFSPLAAEFDTPEINLFPAVRIFLTSYVVNMLFINSLIFVYPRKKQNERSEASLQVSEFFVNAKGKSRLHPN